MLRIDRTVTPTVYRGATLSVLEVEVLSTIKDVIRKGYVRQIDHDKIVLDQGTIDGAPGDLYVDCTAKAFGRHPRCRSSIGTELRFSRCAHGA